MTGVHFGQDAAVFEGFVGGDADVERGERTRVKVNVRPLPQPSLKSAPVGLGDRGVW